MKVYKGFIWEKFYEDKREHKYIVITINGFVKKNGECIMGAGIAKQAAQRYPGLPLRVGNSIIGPEFRTKIIRFQSANFILFPVKYHWQEPASLKLIEKSCQELKEIIDVHNNSGKDYVIYSVKPGCGNGRKSWEEIKLIMEKYFENEDNLVIVDIN